MGLLPSVKILNLLIEQHSKSSNEVANLSSNSASNLKISTSSVSGRSFGLSQIHGPPVTNFPVTL